LSIADLLVGCQAAHVLVYIYLYPASIYFVKWLYSSVEANSDVACLMTSLHCEGCEYFCPLIKCVRLCFLHQSLTWRELVGTAGWNVSVSVHDFSDTVHKMVSATHCASLYVS